MPTTSRGYPYPANTDDADVPGDMQALATAVNTDVSNVASIVNDLYRQGLLSAIGAAGTQGRFYYATDTATLYRDNGSAWVLVAHGIAAPARYFQAWRSAAGLNPAAPYVVLFDAESDPSGWYAPATGRFQPGVAGRYRVTWRVEANAALTADNYWQANLCLSDGTVKGRGTLTYQRGLTALASFGSRQLVLNGSTDALDVRISTNDATHAVRQDPESTYFEAEYIGPS